MPMLEEHPVTRFASPGDATAPAPPEVRGRGRDDVRLLVAGASDLVHTRFDALPHHLRAGDLVIVNDSATVAGQLDAEDLSGRPVVLHLATPLDDGSWVVEVRSAPDARQALLDREPGEVLRVGPQPVRLVEAYPHDGSSPTGHGTRLWRATAGSGLAAYAEAHGRPISYGYLDARYPLAAYQTVFGHRPGSAEMPSAARPFTADLVTALVSRGVGFAPITLHTGVSSQEAGEAPQAERFEVSAATASLVNAVRAGGGRVVAVGTTATRALESAVEDGRVVPRRGWTTRVVTPAEPPQVVTGLVTGWHDPEASHLLLVEAVAGPALTQVAYDAAVAGGYRWHEFGDVGLLLP